jgi:DNA mismatch repair protein MutS
MTISPFHKIATRILNQDNLWAGLSSFAVEMSELREIFQVADDKTLVLGDELCSGTESISATAIVAAGIEWLHKSGTRFVLATHLHDLIKIKRITSLSSLRIWHLHVEYDRVRDLLVYHRELKPGPGSSIYGLEVAHALHLPSDMIESAFSIRRELTGEVAIEDSEASSWNSELVKKACRVCGGFETLHVHHIQERADAVMNRNTDGTPLHHPRNLIVVCKSCHNKHHSEEILIGPIEDTSEGPKQRIEKVEKKIKKISKETLGILQNLKRDFPNLPLKLLLFKAKQEYDICLTEKQFKALEINNHV